MYTSSHVNNNTSPLWRAVHSSSDCTTFLPRHCDTLPPPLRSALSAPLFFFWTTWKNVGMLNKWRVWAAVPFQQGHDADYSDSPEYFWAKDSCQRLNSSHLIGIKPITGWRFTQHTPGITLTAHWMMGCDRAAAAAETHWFFPWSKMKQRETLKMTES